MENVESGSLVLFKVGANVVGASRNLSLSGSNKLIRTTTKENEYNEYEYGRSSWNGSISGLVDLADVGQTSLFAAVQSGGDLSVTIGKSVPATGDLVYSGNVKIDKHGEAYTEGSDSALDISFRGNGPLVQTVTA
jgi:hypothetical protein